MKLCNSHKNLDMIKFAGNVELCNPYYVVNAVLHSITTVYFV